MAPGDELTHIGKKLGNLEHCALHRRTIKLVCPRCRRTRLFDAIALWWMFETRGWNDRIDQVARHFRCADCIVRGIRAVRPTVEITRETPDPVQPPYPDERTWKRLVSRYRS